MMLGSAIVGSMILAMIEGVSLLTSRWMSSMMDPTLAPIVLEDPANLPSPTSKVISSNQLTSDEPSSSSTFGFGLPFMNQNTM